MQNEATIQAIITQAVDCLKASDAPRALSLLEGALLSLATCQPAPAPVKSRAPKGAKTVKAVKAVNPLTLAKGVIPTKSPLPILSRYAIENGRARCTDLENILFFNAPENTPDGVYLDLSGVLVLDKEITLEDFPPVPAPVESTPAAVFQAGDLLRVLSNALPMASTDETRYILNGVFMRRLIDGGPVEIVSTDGRRLHATALPGGAGEPFAGVVRPSAVKVLIKAAAGMEPAAGVPLSIIKYGAGKDEKGAALFDTSFSFDLSGGAAGGGAVLETKEIEGTFPNFEQVIPQTEGTDWLQVKTPVNPAAWLAAFKTLEPVRKHIRKNDSEQAAGTVYLTVTPAGRVSAVLNSCLTGFEKTVIEFDGGGAAGVWRARDKHPETGADIPADSINIALNLSFLLDILKTGPDALSLQDNRSPGLFTAAGGALSVLMPIRCS